ncbi:multidrug effflux MFS transporter [Zooshikella ganghwensis]|uniref:Bcr/CflA family efflux transporter n=1 Tax=Zooshikella ganghwensis TaxID=202772 RepID=A0A4P9VKT1_9GAMM|nr:multidrug effflux MFS transporter [Zooshikella ganghwensis]RDH43918.1 MFS transporter [Zooshikella ganghwensis]
MKSKVVSQFFIAALVPLVLFGPMGIDIYLPSMASLVNYFHTNTNQVQYTLSVFLFTVGIGQLVVGPLCDRFGRRPVVLVGIVLYLLCSLAAAWAPTINWLITARAIQGLGSCCASVVAFAVVRDVFSAAQGAKMYSYLNGCVSVAPALAPMLGGILATQWGWQASFYFLAGFAALVGVMVWFWLDETRPSDTAKVHWHWRPYWEILQHRRFQFYCYCCMVALGMICSYVSVASFIMIETLKLTQIQFALCFGANALVIMASSFLLAPKLMTYLGRHRCVMLGCLLIVIAGLLMLLGFIIHGTTLLGFLLPVMLAGCGFSLILGSAASYALAPFGKSAGTASATLGCLQMVMASVASIITVQMPFSHLMSLSLVMITLAIIPLLLSKSWLGHAFPVENHSCA